MNLNLSDRDILAKTLEAEAGGEGGRGMLGVGAVIMNRIRNGGYGQGMQGVILKDGAFSPWNSVTGYANGAQGKDMMNLQPSPLAYTVADQLLSGGYQDPTGGALNFYNPELSNPWWGQAQNGGEWLRIGRHLFGTAQERKNVSTNPTQTLPPPLEMNPARPKPQGLIDIIGNAIGGKLENLKGALNGTDQDASDRLSVALMSLSGNPQQLAPLMQMAVNDIQQRKLMNQGRNGTVEFLKRQAATGDVRAQTALRMVDTDGPGAALKAYLNNSTGSQAANKTAASTKTYANGTSISVFQDGTKVVTDADNNVLKGEEARAALEAAQANEQEIAEQTEFATQSAQYRIRTFERLQKQTENVSSSLRNYDMAKQALRSAIREGRTISGFFAQYFPNFSLQAQELAFAKRSLGLDVIGSVTFGALSKGELDLALEQGLPDNLSMPQLLEYIERRELAQYKYLKSLEAAAQWYATDGNDLKDFEEATKAVEVVNLYAETPDDELVALVQQVRSGMSDLPPASRQMILDEAAKRAGR